MPCHVIRYKNKSDGSIAWALVDNGFYTIDCNSQDLRSFLVEGQHLAWEMADNLEAYKSQRLDQDAVEVLAPVTAPCRILCQGSNYPQSRIETGMDPDDKNFNTIFHKSDASLAGPRSDIIRPNNVKLLDYEVELGVVIGTDIQQPVKVTPDNLHKYIAGIVMAHDVTARDIQIPQIQFFKGKSYRTFCPVGPYLCLLREDETKYLNELNLSLMVNGELRQSDCSGNMIFAPHETISELSEISDLAPGDMLLTGSPGGCALSVPGRGVVKMLGLLPEKLKWKMFVQRQAKNPHYLKPGDQIEARITSFDRKIDLGIQSNSIVD